MIYLVAGTRPNFMKVAPIVRVLQARRHRLRLLHTGQHYDAQMSQVFFDDLGMPAPDLCLAVGGGSQAQQTAGVLVGVERDLLATKPEMVVVVGDVTSTLAAALAAAKLGIPCVHVEAGLRSGDWTMPEEINRVLTDQLADLLLLPSHDAAPNLQREGIAPERCRFVGNVMIDSLHYALGKSDMRARLGLQPRRYAVATTHRAASVDSAATLNQVIDCLQRVAQRLPLLFPVHPRTAARARQFGLWQRLESIPGLSLLEPTGYNDFSNLLAEAALVVTDSGGIQEESTALQVPCLTLRDGTERPITVTEGTNTICGLSPEMVAAEVDAILAGRGKQGRIPDGWDGHAAERIVDCLESLRRGDPPPKTQVSAGAS